MIVVGDREAVAADVEAIEGEVEIARLGERLAPVARERGLAGDEIDGLAHDERDARRVEDDVVRVVREDRVEVAAVPDRDPVRGEVFGPLAVEHGGLPSRFPAIVDPTKTYCVIFKLDALNESPMSYELVSPGS